MAGTVSSISSKKMRLRSDPPKIIAKTGWTTAELLQGIADSKISPTVRHVVSLLIGVNNQYRKQDIDVYRAEFENLLEKAIQFAGQNNNRVIVISIPDWSVTPYFRRAK